MGDPRKIQSKYSGPVHPWEKERIEEEKLLIKEYGLKNKKEIWKVDSTLTSFKDQVKKLSALSGEQADKEKQQLFSKLVSLGLLQQESQIGDVLEIDLRQLMDRRLQSQVHKLGLARSMNQARQMIVHRHVKVNGKKLDVPSYLVKIGEQITFSDKSAFKDDMHPERAPPEQLKKEKKKVSKEDEEEALAYKEEELMDEDQMALAEVKKKEAEAKQEEQESADETAPAEQTEAKPVEEKPAEPEKKEEEKPAAEAGEKEDKKEDKK